MPEIGRPAHLTPAGLDTDVSAAEDPTLKPIRSKHSKSDMFIPMHSLG